MLTYRSIQQSSDCDETFTGCWKHARGGFGNLRKLKIVLAGVSCVALHFDLDDILHTWTSKQEKNHCLHDHPPFPSLLPGLPGVLMLLEMTTCAIFLKRFINFFFSFI